MGIFLLERESSAKDGSLNICLSGSPRLLPLSYAYFETKFLLLSDVESGEIFYDRSVGQNRDEIRSQAGARRSRKREKQKG